MMLAIFLLCSVFVGVGADKWAILVAGSNGYWNYRHQADVCHAYQVLHRNGYPDNRIIVMMYDDIAYSKDNPIQGNVINRPGGPNLYPGVLKDYTGDQVNPANFLNIIKGIKSTNTTKVLESGPDDDVFVYFADHGGPGLIAFPNDYLYAHELLDALKTMHDKHMYRTLLFYLEACESGSMFNGILDPGLNIYATTAATPFESSYACYYDEFRQAYLGDVYSVNWLENSGIFHVKSESVHDQFEIDRIETKTSTVCEYGNLTVADLPLYRYLAYNVSDSEIPTDGMCRVRSNLTDILVSYHTKFRYYLDRGMEDEFTALYLKHLSEMWYIATNYDTNQYPNKSESCHDKTRVIDSRCMQEHIERMESVVGKLTDQGLSFLKPISRVCYKK
jgi:hypothetical protein